VHDIDLAVQLNISKASATLRADLDSWAARIQHRLENINFTPNDYNPPTYDGNITAETKRQEEDSQVMILLPIDESLADD
jgi:hypothetical protein